MDYFELIKVRKSVRKFKEKEIGKDLENKILEAARIAPSAGNLQGYGIIAIRNKEIKIQLSKAALNQKFISKAPLVLVFYADQKRSSGKYSKRGEELYSIQDATIATTFAHLAAANLGLGSVWVGAFIDKDVSNILNLPNDKKPVAILPIGYPDTVPKDRPRRSINDIVKFLN